uniref:Uncharacterized protein n=1 Tax=Pristionchus pacificus TaxID=54126 RepID=A0A2A6BNW5_PRIPA|eukprot:PDM67528.1 hypothetical protein PRIPAC_48945 [Pristionchus pacificus]
MWLETWALLRFKKMILRDPMLSEDVLKIHEGYLFISPALRCSSHHWLRLWRTALLSGTAAARYGRKDGVQEGEIE